MAKEKLVTEVQQVVSDAEELVRLTGDGATGRLAEVRNRLSGHLDAAKNRLSDLDVTVRKKTKAAARATDDYVHDHPWRAIGMAAGIGVLIGLLINRR